jgi:hypothetical protein
MWIACKRKLHEDDDKYFTLGCFATQAEAVHACNDALVADALALYGTGNERLWIPPTSEMSEVRGYARLREWVPHRAHLYEVTTTPYAPGWWGGHQGAITEKCVAHYFVLVAPNTSLTTPPSHATPRAVTTRPPRKGEIYDDVVAELKLALLRRKTKIAEAQTS